MHLAHREQTQIFTRPGWTESAVPSQTAISASAVYTCKWICYYVAFICICIAILGIRAVEIPSENILQTYINVAHIWEKKEEKRVLCCATNIKMDLEGVDCGTFTNLYSGVGVFSIFFESFVCSRCSFIYNTFLIRFYASRRYRLYTYIFLSLYARNCLRKFFWGKLHVNCEY